MAAPYHLRRLWRCYGARVVLRGAERRGGRGGGAQTTALAARPWRTDVGDEFRARSAGAVLDQPRLRVPRRGLRWQHRVWSRLPRSTQRAMGRRRWRGSEERRGGE